MDSLTELDQRIDRLCAAASRAQASPELAEQMDDALSEGYARALQVEQELVELDEQLVELLLTGDARRARKIAVVDAKRRALGRRAVRLREQLDRMHHCFVVLSAR